MTDLSREYTDLSFSQAEAAAVGFTPDLDVSEIIDEQSQTEGLVTTDLPKTRTRAEKIRNMLAAGSLGLLAVGGVVALMENPIGEMKDQVVEAAPWAGGAILASEAMWILGAGMALGGAGKKVGNPLKIRKRADAEGLWSDTNESVYSSTAFKAGLRINTLGAIGTAGAIAGGAFTALPAETWPGAVGLAAVDIAGTVALRAPLYNGVHRVAKAEKQNKVTVRHAKLEDIDRLADLDRELFEGAYGEELPSKEAVVDMLTARFNNAKEWMYVAEMGGQVEGFVTAFRTNKSKEEFVSWEDTTANGTLDGKGDPEGKYIYVVNMTIARKAVKQGAKDMLLANLFANAMHKGGIEYGYFESRMPMFREWLESTGQLTDDPEELHKLAQQYVEMPGDDGKLYDKQLRMYEGDGFKHGYPVAGAFKDAASMDYGVVFSTPNPAGGKFFQAVPPARWAFAGAVRTVAKHPKLLAKVL